MHQHYSVMTRSIRGQTRACVRGVKAAAGDGGAASGAPDESNGGQVECVACVCEKSFVFQSVPGQGWLSLLGVAACICIMYLCH